MEALSIEEKYRTLDRILTEMNRLAVAFSGGVDSSFLLKAARDRLGDRLLAVTAISETTPRHERDFARQLAADLGVRHLVLETRELDLPEFTANTPERCYICKKYRFTLLFEEIRRHGFTLLADGENLDDLDDFRPGRRACWELGVRSPLREAGLTKADIRELSRRLHLPTWNRPSSACLVSRIPYHTPVTAEHLRRIDGAEAFLRSLGITDQVRVRRVDDTSVRIETDPAAIRKLAEPETREKVVRHFAGLGIRSVALDLAGYRTGSLNDALSPEERKNG